MINRIGCADNFKYKKPLSFQGKGQLIEVTKTTEGIADSLGYKAHRGIRRSINRLIDSINKKGALLKEGEGHFDEDLSKFRFVNVQGNVKFDKPVTAQEIYFEDFTDSNLNVEATVVRALRSTLGKIKASTIACLDTSNAKTIDSKFIVGITGTNNNVEEITAGRSVVAENLKARLIKAGLSVQTKGKCTIGSVDTNITSLGEGTTITGSKQFHFDISEDGKLLINTGDGFVLTSEEHPLPIGLSYEDLQSEETILARIKEQEADYRELFKSFPRLCFGKA